MPKVECIQCNTQVDIIPARLSTFKFCSYACRGKWRAENWQGENNPRWQGGVRTKSCQHCGTEFGLNKNEPVTNFRKRKFCCKPCADEGGVRASGDAHHNWSGGTSKRSARQAIWSRAVLSRDGNRCTKCGAEGGELHAHHILPHKTYPALRWELSNGVTLCAPCHWAEHSAKSEKGVNSGKAAAGKAGGNPEPSRDGNISEGVTTRGRAYRRWSGACGYCGAFLSRRPSDVTGKAAVFCNRTCRGKWTSDWKSGKPTSSRYGSNAPTSALRESDDIVCSHVKA
jgi:hypothetical protein